MYNISQADIGGLASSSLLQCGADPDTLPSQEDEVIFVSCISCLPTETIQSRQGKGFAALVPTHGEKAYNF